MIKAYAIYYVLNAKLSFIYKTNKDAKNELDLSLSAR